MRNFQPLDDEENYLMEAIEAGNTEPVSKEEENKVLAAIRNSKNKSISIRVNENDLNGLKQKADRAGIPYQTLINSILHRYVIGDIFFKESI